MRSFIVLALVSSAFSIPVLKDIANVPAEIKAPVGAVAGAAVKAAAPVKAAFANADLKNVNISNGVDSDNKIVSRQSNNVSIPALPTVLGSAQVNATKIAGTIQSLLASTPVGSALAGPLSELNGVLTGATNQLGLLNGLGLGAILQSQGGEVEVSTQQAAQSVANLTQTISGAVEQVTEKLGTSVPELAPVISLLNGSINGLLSTVTSLLPGITGALGTLLGPLSGTLNSLGLGLGLGLVGGL